MGDPLGSSAHVSSQKQNREGVVGAQTNNITLRRCRARDMVEPGSGCNNLVSEPIPDQKCADEDFGPLRGMDC